MVYQIIEAVTKYGAISKCMYILLEYLEKIGYENQVLTRHKDSRISDGRVIVIDDYRKYDFKPDDIVFYHFSDGHIGNRQIYEADVKKKILVYHNVTPPKYFEDVNRMEFFTRLWGEYDIRRSKDGFSAVMAMSEYSRQQLINIGFSEENIVVVPLLRTDRIINNTIISEHNSSNSILFVGRVAPNKKIEDIIEVFAGYNKKFDSSATLNIVGSISYTAYYNAICEYIDKLGVENVHFAGEVSNAELDSYYRKADVFLCMSEHEGMCIPLVEAMQRGIPVVSYHSTAIADTLGKAGIVVESFLYTIDS